MNEHRDSGENNLPSIDLKKAGELLRKDQAKLDETFLPNSFVGRIRMGLAERLPFLRDSLETAPMEEMRARLRGVALDLTNALPSLLDNGRTLMVNHRELLELYCTAKEKPEEWELTEKLDKKLNEVALEDKSLRLSEDTEKLIAEILRSDDPDERKKEQEIIFAAAEGELNLTEPIVRVSEAAIKAVASLRKRVVRQYTTVMRVSPALDQIHRTSRILIEAVDAGASSRKEMVQILTQGLKTVAFVMQVNELDRQLGQAKDLPELLQISQAAEEILKGAKNEDPEGN